MINFFIRVILLCVACFVMYGATCEIIEARANTNTELIPMGESKDVIIPYGAINISAILSSQNLLYDRWWYGGVVVPYAIWGQLKHWSFKHFDIGTWNTSNIICPIGTDMHIKRRSFPSVLVSHVCSENAFGRWVDRFSIVKRHNPCTIVTLKIKSHVTPLPISDYGITYSSDHRDDFQSRYPPMRGLIPFIFGVIGLFWSWMNIDNNRGELIHAIVFIISLILCAYGSYILLLWSVRDTYFISDRPQWMLFIRFSSFSLRHKLIAARYKILTPTSDYLAAHG